MDFLKQFFQYDNHSVTCGLSDELNVFYVLELFKKANKNIIVLASSIYEANKFYNLIQIYNHDVLLFLHDDYIIASAKTDSSELKISRLNTLDKINNGKHIVIANLMGYIKYLPNRKNQESAHIKIKVGDIINRSELIEKITNLGYVRESLTTTTGEYSVRGFIIDIFLINEKHPIRIELDDNTIESIRYYDETTQASLKTIDNIIISPITEIESDRKSTLIDYSEDSIVVYLDYPQLKVSYQKLQKDLLDYVSNGVINESDIKDFNDINPSYELFLNKLSTSKKDIVIDTRYLEQFNQDYDLLKKFVYEQQSEGKKIIFALSKVNEQKRIREMFADCEIINIEINRGFIIGKYVVISEYDIENVKREYKYQNKLFGGKKIVDYNELSKGDYVVHISHGIGIYNGLATLTKNGIEKDYLQIIYQGNDKIYVPVEKITSIYKYSDKDGHAPKLNHLNSSTWLKTKQFVQRKIEDISKELYALYQKRASTFCESYKHYVEEEIFGAEFPYELTLDQQKAVNDIFNDLSTSIPMDRLLCGDVGFGKTEVALRAMFKTVLNNKQVLYLCPTTILSKQQYKVAKNRFSSWPIEIALLNRFTTAKEEKEILDKLQKGTIDILFGTHKVLNDKIKFKDLGLMIIDEEQRFGVKHKEKIKELKNDINVLTMSATPIPRTLKMALSGLRDLSIIDTAPNNRYPVQTYVINEDELIVKDAIYKELSRNGQVFILYNNVENIEEKTNSLRRLIPNEEIRYAHGQMNKDDLDKIMDDFVQHEFNIIVCTTIIENGIDIPNANTLIVYNADYLGLSQLYQIRGRVGRGDRIAYAYFLYNEHKALNETAVKRLQAIREYTELGSGYRIAMRDLSIRGAGDIFGASQAGFVDSVGISLYTKMLEDEMRRQKGEIVESDDGDDTSLINVATHINDEYVSDEDIKIEIHQLINQIDSYDKLHEIKSTIEDRFGKMNDSLEIYMYEEWFEKIAKKLHITKVKQTDRLIEIELPVELSQKIKGDKLMYAAFSISSSFNLAYRHNAIIITLYYKNLDDHFIKYIVKLLNTL